MNKLISFVTSVAVSGFIAGGFIAFYSSLDVSASSRVNNQTYDSVKRAWSDTIFKNYSNPSKPPIADNLPFNTADGAYNNISNFAYDSKPSGNGFYPTGQTATLDGDPNETSVTESVSGSETLTNNLSTPLNMQSNSVTYSVTNGTSVTTTHAFDLGYSNTASFNIFFVKDKMTVKADYNFSHAGTQSDSTTITRTIPSQTIPVKPGHTVVVDYVMSLGTATGNLNLNANLTGNSVSGLPKVTNGNKYVDSDFNKMGDLLQGCDDKNSFSYVSPDTVAYTGGSATYNSSHYSNTQLRVYDQTSGETNLYALDKNDRAIIEQ